MGYRTLVVVILAAHFAFLGYVLLGGFLAARWRWSFWPHLAAAAWGLYTVTLGAPCPLTAAEAWARVRAGEPAPTSGFIDRYVKGVLYPGRYTVVVDVLVAAVVAGSWLLAYRRWRRATGGRDAGRGFPAAARGVPPS